MAKSPQDLPPKKPMNIWLLAPRLPFLTATIGPVIVGLAMVWEEITAIHLFHGLLTFVGVALLHLGTNLINDYFDFGKGKGTDALNKNVTPFSGGSPTLRENLLSSRALFAYALVCFIGGSLIGVYFVLLRGLIILYIGIFAVVSGFFYVGPPLKLAHRGIGELIIGVNFGPLAVFGTYFVQTGIVALQPFLVGIPVGILITLVIWINEFPDEVADKKAGKNTLVVRLGLDRSMKVYSGLMYSMYLSLILLVVFNYAPIPVLLGLLTFPKARFAIQTAKTHLHDKGIIGAMATTIMVHFLTDILIFFGFFLTPFLRLVLPI
ncbi:MAG: 1,4-dihydroxy-2-naphthoate octaprenyltransferase [Candidatus Ranarchaeia archaeon]|jgi:1,4-dihydroxy-2-naphthoate octaprenyltransferase